MHLAQVPVSDGGTAAAMQTTLVSSPMYADMLLTLVAVSHPLLYNGYSTGCLWRGSDCLEKVGRRLVFLGHEGEGEGDESPPTSFEALCISNW